MRTAQDFWQRYDELEGQEREEFWQRFEEFSRSLEQALLRIEDPMKPEPENEREDSK